MQPDQDFHWHPHIIQILYSLHKNYIQEKNSDYNNLSKIDAYVLHYISIFNYNKASTETTKKIIQQNKEKEVKLRKSLHKDYGYFS